MSTYTDMTFCPVASTPVGFDEKKFKAGDPEQALLYKNSKKPNQGLTLTYEQVTDEKLNLNYARFIPKGCMYIDFDNMEQALTMRRIILRAKLRCLILETQHGYHFLFRRPAFVTKDCTGATNWFGYKFDSKHATDDDAKIHKAVQFIRVCGMTREERLSWDLSSPVVPETINIEALDYLPYWLWGVLRDKDLYKAGKPGESVYHITDTPFTQLMELSEGSRHDHIVTRCSYFACSNGFEISEFKDIIRMIHDEFLIKIGSPMTESDLFGDLKERWDGYITTLKSSGHTYDPETRTWSSVTRKKDDKIDERRAAEYLYSIYDFYVRNAKNTGLYTELLYREKDASFEYQTDLTVTREALKKYSEQNFKMNYFEEVEDQLMQICAENNKQIRRSYQYVIAKNKVMSCVMPDVYDFTWLGTKTPTDVVFNWTWQTEDWVNEHEADLGKYISEFIKQLARNSSGKTDPIVEQWLYVIAGAAMIPANALEKIIVLSGGGGNGKSIYTSLIRLCLGGDMFNLSKIFDSSPQDSFWGSELDHGICCIVDDMPQRYNKEAFSYIKGAITKTDTVVINEKFKPKRELRVLPMIISCTNHEFELYDKSEGMKRRVLILPTEYKVPVEERDNDLQYKLVLNTADKKEIAEYRMKDNTVGNDEGVLVMHMMSKERGVLDSLDHGSLCWFANKARYMYFKWLYKEIILESSEGMKEKFDGTFSGGYEAELQEFLEWYIIERRVGAWLKELYGVYVDWHEEMSTGDRQMTEKVFSMKIGKAIKYCNDKGYKVLMKRRRNEKSMILNYVFVGSEVPDEKEE